jgi:cystathionine beta-synthase
MSVPSLVVPAPPRVVDSVTDLVGSTPMVKVRNIRTGVCDLYLKLESHNPGGSIKDRIALRMIDAAERAGKIGPGATLVEATAGNTGLSLALVARQRGYKVILVVFDKVSREKIAHLEALGAEIVVTRTSVPAGHPDHYLERAARIADATPGGFYVNQFENPSNPEAHETSTGPEIWWQMEQHVDAIVCGVGSGGTLTGIGRYFRRVSPATDVVLADPEGSVLAPYVSQGVLQKTDSANWLVEGIGEDFIPRNCDLSLVDYAYTIPDVESIATSRALLLQEGILGGSSSGTLVAAALRYCRQQTEAKRVVTFICDSGSKYLSKIYNPGWLWEHGLVGGQNFDPALPDSADDPIGA